MIVREAAFDDYEQISALARRYKLEVKSLDDWVHLWKECPLGDAGPIGWVLETADKSIAGFLGNISLNYYFDGRCLKAFATHLWVVEQTARSQSLLLLNKFLRQSADLLLNTTANFEAQKIFDAYRIARVPTCDYDVVLFWITEPYGFAKSVLKKKRVPMARVLCIPFGLLSSFKRPAPTNDQKVTEQRDFGPEFDLFWEELARQSKRLLGNRGTRWLKWHFKNAIAENKLWIFTCRNQGKLQSYALFLRHDTPELDLTRVRLVDYQSLDESSSSLGSMIDLAICKCREAGIHMLESIGFDQKKRAILESKHPLRRKLPSWTFFFKANEASLMSELTQAANWDPCLYDGDSSL